MSPCRIRQALISFLIILGSAKLCHAEQAHAVPVITASNCEVRLTLSNAVSKIFSESRFRQFVVSNMGEGATLSTQPVGPLNDNVVHIWIDQTENQSILIQSRIGDRALLQRTVPIENLNSDVAMRITAIATSEIIRAQVRSWKRRSLTKKLVPADNLTSFRQTDALDISTASTLVTTMDPSFRSMLGPMLTLQFRRSTTSLGIYSNWLVGLSDPELSRLYETGITAEQQLWVGTQSRLSIGAFTGASWFYASGETQRSARAGAAISFATRAIQEHWAFVQLQPGVLLQAVQPNESMNGFHGGFVQLSLGMTFDVPLNRKSN